MPNTTYQLIRQKRKTLTITIVGGQAIVKAPLNFPQAKIDEFVAKKQSWILSKVETYNSRYEKFNAILSYEKFIIGGVELQCIYAHTKKIELKNNILYIPAHIYQHNALLQPALKKFYLQLTTTYLSKRTNELAIALQINYNTLTLSNATTRWGSCDSRANIRLNWRLILLPPDIVDYIITHELCHTIHLNHSPTFWQLVQTHIKNYKQLKQQLKEHNLLISYLK